LVLGEVGASTGKTIENFVSGSRTSEPVGNEQTVLSFAQFLRSLSPLFLGCLLFDQPRIGVDKFLDTILCGFELGGEGGVFSTVSVEQFEHVRG